MKETTFKIYNDIFKEDDRNSSKFYVLYNPNMRFLLTANEMCTFYQIVHICNLNRNSASLNFLAKLLKTSNKTLQKITNQLITLKLISRNRSHYGTYYYTLNLEVIAEVYDKLNSCHTLEDREVFCKKYIEDCEKNAVSKNDTPMEEITIPMVNISTPMEKISTHISNICIKEDDLNKKNEFNKENESYKEDVAVEKSADAITTNEVANAKTFFNDNFETEDKIEMNKTVDMLFNDTSTDTNTSNETANAETSIDNGKTDCSINDNITADAITSNKAQISTLNENITDSSTNDKSFNRELKNDINTDNSKESINNKNKLNMKQQAKEYFKTVLNEVSRLNRINSTDVSKLKIYYDVIKTLSIDEIDKKEMLDKCSEYINEISSKETANANVTNEVANAETSFNNDNIENKTDIPTLVEKTTDTSIEEISSNTEQINSADADTSIDESFNIEEAIKNNMEFQRYYTNINVAFTKRSIATLRLYKKMFSSNVEYLSKREIEELKNLASDAKRKLQVELNIAS